MADLNVVSLVGRVGKAPELRQIPNSEEVVTSVGLANSKWKKVGDNFEEETSWFDVEFFGYNAKNVVEKVKTGHRIAVTGKLKQRTWEDKDGNKRERVSVVANQVQFLEKQPKTDPLPTAKSDVPF